MMEKNKPVPGYTSGTMVGALLIDAVFFNLALVSAIAIAPKYSAALDLPVVIHFVIVVLGAVLPNRVRYHYDPIRLYAGTCTAIGCLLIVGGMFCYVAY